MKLHILIEVDEDGNWSVEAPALGGCMAQGKTRDEALENMKVAVEGCVFAIEEKSKVDPARMTEYTF